MASESATPSLLRQIMPADAGEAILQHPEFLIQLLTAEDGPFRANADQLIEFVTRLQAIVQRKLISVAQVIETIHHDSCDPADRIGQALDVILDSIPNLNEADPAIKDHRAWIIDMVLRCLAGDLYPTLRSLLHPPYYEGIEPPKPSPKGDRIS